MKRFIKAHRRLVMTLLFLCGIGFLGAGIYLVFDYEKEMQTGYERLSEEASLADEYILYLLELKKQLAQETETKETSETEFEISKEPTEPTLDDTLPELPSFEPTPETTPSSTAPLWEDNLWLYSPDYAQGTIECVLEVPCAKIRRGVYTGAIENDLNYWMVVAARDEYELGKTHYTIYGHNSTKHDLSFNNLQPNCKLGDTFTLTNIDGVYEYTITNLFSVSRKNATKQYVDNFNLSSDLCYIITCGRNEHRYKDFIVEGTLTKFTPLEDLLK